MYINNKLKTNLIPLLLLIILTIIIFYKFFFEGLIPFPGNYMLAWFEPWKTDHFINNVISIPHKAIAEDVFRQTYPFRTLAIDIMKNFQLPLWNPYNGSGMPLLATINTGFLDPFNLIFFFIPYYLAWGIYITLQPLLIGISTYLFCRKISLGNKSSIFSAVSFMLSGVIVVRLVYVMFGLAFAMLPFILYLLESYLQNKKTKLIFLLPICIFSLIVSTVPQISFYIIFLAFLYLTYRIVAFKNQEFKIRNVLFLTFLSLIGIGLSSIQLLPTYELFQNASINKETSQFIFQHYLMPIQHLVTILIPNYFGSPSTYNYWGYADYIETATYVGLIPCFFALLGILKRISDDRFRIRFFFLLTLIASLLLSTDSFFTRWLYAYPIPIISTGVPTRIFLISVFSITILAGFGFEFLVKKEISIKKFLLNALIFSFPVLIIAFATIFAYIANTVCPPGPIIHCRIISVRNLSIEIVGMGIVIILSFLALLKTRKASFFPFIIIAIVCVIGIYNTSKFLPFSGKETFLPENSLMKIIQEKTKDGRVFGLGEANIKTDFATNFKFYDPQYYHPLYIKRYGELVGYANSGILDSALARSDVEITNDLQPTNNDLEQKRNRLFNFLSVKYLIFKKNAIQNLNENNIFWQDNNWIIFKNPSVLPRAYFVENFEVIKDKKQILTQMFSSTFNFTNSVILEESPNFDKNNLNNATSKIKQISYTPNNSLFETNTSDNSLLILTDNYYPGWKAYVDGRETKIYRANYTFRALVVPSGIHTVKFSYEPDSVKIGIAISLISMSLYLIFYIIRRSRKNE